MKWFFCLLVVPLLTFSTLKSIAKDRPAHRIVSLTPAITETLFDLKLGSELVGTASLSSWPEEAKKIPRVGSYQKPSLEKILALKPSIVITQKEGVDRISKSLKNAGVKLVSYDSERLDDFPAMLRDLGDIFIREDQANELITEWNNSFSSLPLPFRQVPLIVAIEPASGIYLGQSNFINDLLKRCGGENLIESSGFPKISREKLSALNPEKILLLSMENSSSDRKEIENIPAFKNKPIVNLDSNKFSRLSMSLARHARSFCDAVVLNK